MCIRDSLHPGKSLKGGSAPENVHLARMCGRGVLDAYGWRPLSTEWDYRETMRRIYREVYPSEVIEESVPYDASGDSLISVDGADFLDKLNAV